MMRLRIVAGALLAFLGLSCAQEPSAPSAPSAGTARPGGATAAPAARGGQNIPADARWTLYCATYADSDHLARARAMRDHLLRTTGMPDWYIVHSEGHTTLYYGFYREINDRIDKAEAARAQADRKAIAALTDPATGAKLFRAVLAVAMDSPDPAAPPEWNLANAGDRGYYSLQIGVCKDHPMRKQLAVEAVREARASGIEAYYYHGPTASSVCVGLWPESAVRRVTEAKAKNPGDVVMLVPGSISVPPTAVAADGTPVEIVQAKVEILDPSLLEMIKRFPTQSINGYESRKVRNPRTGQVREVRDPSILVVVPRSAQQTRTRIELGGTGGGEPPVRSEADKTADTAPPDPFKPAPRPPPRGGRLRSIEDP